MYSLNITQEPRCSSLIRYIFLFVDNTCYVDGLHGGLNERSNSLLVIFRNACYFYTVAAQRELLVKPSSSTYIPMYVRYNQMCANVTIFRIMLI